MLRPLGRRAHRLRARLLGARPTARRGAVHVRRRRPQGRGASSQLPLELRNQVARVEIAGERSAGAVHLLDARSRWNRIGLVSGESREQAQPLLAPLYYIEKALGAVLRAGPPEGRQPRPRPLADAFKQNVSVLMLADIGTLSGELLAKVDDWVKKGGVLVRFAGPRLEKGGDPLLPVALRLGGRTLGGALSWSTPQPLAAFDDKSLFAGLADSRRGAGQPAGARRSRAL